jgi:hypothetical protein
LRAEFHGDFFAVDHEGFLLEVRLPDFLGMALREAHIVAVLFAFAGDVTFLHKLILKIQGVIVAVLWRFVNSSVSTF